MLAAEMRAGKIQFLADEIRQRHPHIDQTLIVPSVDGNFDHLLRVQRLTVTFALASADTNVLRANTPPTSLR